MDAKERIRKAMHQEPTDRPPCICPGGMMNMITTDLMDEANVSWPEAHLNARMMADLAEANYEKGCFENVGVPFCMTIEAEAMGAQVTMGSKIYACNGICDQFGHRVGDYYTDEYGGRESKGCTGCNPYSEIQKLRCTDYRKYYGTGQHSKFRYGAGYFL